MRCDKSNDEYNGFNNGEFAIVKTIWEGQESGEEWVAKISGKWWTKGEKTRVMSKIAEIWSKFVV